MHDALEPDLDDDPALIFTLESIKKNAKWVRRIFVLQDPSCESVWKRKIERNVIPEPGKSHG